MSNTANRTSAGRSALGQMLSFAVNTFALWSGEGKQCF